MTRVSVCIPVYNRAQEVDRAISSARGQTYDDLEVVVVDNASTDETWAVLQRHAAEDARVRIYRNPGTLPRVQNWRRCLELSRGEYVKLLFSDDWLSPTALEIAVETLRSRADVAFVYSAMTWHYDPVQTCYLEARTGSMHSLQFLIRSATIEDSVPVSTSCTLARRSDLLEVFQDDIPTRLPFGFSHGLGYEAVLLWRCAARYPYVFHVAEALTHSADPHSGEPNTRMQIGEQQQQMMWWAYRNAFAHSLLAGISARDRRAIQAALFLSCVPLRPRAAVSGLRLFRRLIPPPIRWWAFNPLAAPVRPLLWRRLSDPLDPTLPL